MNKRNMHNAIYRILLLIMLGCFVLGKVATIPLLSFQISFFEISAGVFVVYSFFAYSKYIHTVLKLPIVRSFLPLFAYMGVSLLLVLAMQSSFFIVSGAYTARLFLLVSLFFPIYAGIKSKAVSRKHMMQILLFACFSLSVLGILQYVLLPDTRFLFFLGWDDHYYRLISTLFDPPFTGAIAAVALLLTLNGKRAKHTFIFLAVFLLTALLTYSRATYIALGASLISLAVLKRSKLPIVVLGILLVCIPLLPRPASEGARLERTASIEARQNDIAGSIQSFTARTWSIGNGWYVTHAQRQPKLGIEASHSSAPGNSYIHVVESLGILGFAAFAYGIVRTLFMMKGKHAFISMMVFLGIGSLFNNLLFYPWILLLAMAVAAVESTEDM